MHTIKVRINGKDYEDEVEPRLLLVHYLRDKVHLTGTHVGCDTGNCGACTVFLNGEAIKSCNMLAVQADGAELTTVEGLAKDGALHPVQEAFLDKFAIQCGYCTPGMMISALALIKSNPNPSEAEIREAIEGNICMCTGYEQIVDAIAHAASLMRQSRSA
ncbi:MAG: (2Fe-2S)-binding protein [Betaproteobacteria bacterium]|nr:(2Fe-2S)-binding protein [Betaproteobacteria bacterium]